jgi:hypothetical protein
MKSEVWSDSREAHRVKWQITLENKHYEANNHHYNVYQQSNKEVLLPTHRLLRVYTCDSVDEVLDWVEYLV